MKRVLSLVLCLCLVISLFSTSVMAEENEEVQDDKLREYDIVSVYTEGSGAVTYSLDGGEFEYLPIMQKRTFAVEEEGTPVIKPISFGFMNRDIELGLDELYVTVVRVGETDDQNVWETVIEKGQLLDNLSNTYTYTDGILYFTPVDSNPLAVFVWFSEAQVNFETMEPDDSTSLYRYSSYGNGTTEVVGEPVSAASYNEERIAIFESESATFNLLPENGSKFLGFEYEDREYRVSDFYVDGAVVEGELPQGFSYNAALGQLTINKGFNSYTPISFIYSGYYPWIEGFSVEYQSSLFECFYQINDGNLHNYDDIWDENEYGIIEFPESNSNHVYLYIKQKSDISLRGIFCYDKNYEFLLDDSCMKEDMEDVGNNTYKVEITNRKISSIDIFDENRVMFGEFCVNYNQYDGNYVKIDDVVVNSYSPIPYEQNTEYKFNFYREGEVFVPYNITIDNVADGSSNIRYDGNDVYISFNGFDAYFINVFETEEDYNWEHIDVPEDGAVIRYRSCGQGSVETLVTPVEEVFRYDETAQAFNSRNISYLISPEDGATFEGISFEGEDYTLEDIISGTAPSFMSFDSENMTISFNLENYYFDDLYFTFYFSGGAPWSPSFVIKNTDYKFRIEYSINDGDIHEIFEKIESDLFGPVYFPADGNTMTINIYEEDQYRGLKAVELTKYTSEGEINRLYQLEDLEVLSDGAYKFILPDFDFDEMRLINSGEPIDGEFSIDYDCSNNQYVLIDDEQVFPGTCIKFTPNKEYRFSFYNDNEQVRPYVVDVDGSAGTSSTSWYQNNDLIIKFSEGGYYKVNFYFTKDEYDFAKLQIPDNGVMMEYMVLGDGNITPLSDYDSAISCNGRVKEAYDFTEVRYSLEGNNGNTFEGFVIDGMEYRINDFVIEGVVDQSKLPEYLTYDLEDNTLTFNLNPNEYRYFEVYFSGGSPWDTQFVVSYDINNFHLECQFDDEGVISLDEMYRSDENNAGPIFVENGKNTYIIVEEKNEDVMVKGLCLHYHNDDGTYYQYINKTQMERLPNGKYKTQIDTQNIDMVQVIDTFMPMNNEMAINYQTNSERRIEIGDAVLCEGSSNILPYVTNEEIAMTVYENGNAISPYKVIGHIDGLDFEFDINNNICTYTPDFNNPVYVDVYYTQQEYEYDNFEDDPNKAKLEIFSDHNGLSHVVNSVHSVEDGKRIKAEFAYETDAAIIELIPDEGCQFVGFGYHSEYFDKTDFYVDGTVDYSKLPTGFDYDEKNSELIVPLTQGQWDNISINYLRDEINHGRIEGAVNVIGSDETSRNIHIEVLDGDDCVRVMDLEQNTYYIFDGLELNKEYTIKVEASDNTGSEYIARFEQFTLLDDTPVIINMDIQKRGDVNKNGTIDIADASMIQMLCASILEYDNEYMKNVCDYDNDNRVTVLDVTDIQMTLSKQR